MTNEQHAQLVGKLAYYLDYATNKGAFGGEQVVDWYNTVAILQNWKHEPCEDCGKKKKVKDGGEEGN